MIDILIFSIFPYIVATGLIVGSVYRYYYNRFSYSSISSQFLENSKLYWGSISFHYGIVIVLISHLAVALFPDTWISLTGETVRLYILELTGISLGFLSFFGLSLLVIRRITNRKIQMVTSKMDGILLIFLLIQVFTGVFIALAYRWGSLWYLDTAVPWIQSLLILEPKIEFIQNLPIIAKAHFFNALLLVLLIPFTRLIHFLTTPLTYLWRPYQVVIWNRRAQSQGGDKP